MCDKKCQYYIRTHAKIISATMELNESLAARAKADGVTENSILQQILDYYPANSSTIDDLITASDAYLAALENLKSDIVDGLGS